VASLQHKHCNTLQHTATHCNALQHTATHCNTLQPWRCAYSADFETGHSGVCLSLSTTSEECTLDLPRTTLQHTATHCKSCNTLQHTATAQKIYLKPQCNTVQHSAAQCNTLQHTATHCNTLQHTATHCNTLQQRMRSTSNQSSKPCQVAQYPQHKASAWVYPRLWGGVD